MSSRKPTRENLLETLPLPLRVKETEFLQTDKSIIKLADAMAQVLAQRPEEIDRLRIYPDIFRLDEKLLDILAYDFKVDWWDGEYSLEEKRRILRDNWNVHRTLGTKYAVETVLKDIFPGAYTEEWFQYGGTPYCFRLFLPVGDGGVSQEKQRSVLSRIWYYKNLRSHLEGFTLEWENTGINRMGAYVSAVETVEIWPELITQIEAFGCSNTAGAMEMIQTAEVWPEMASQMETTAVIGNSSFPALEQTIEIFPEGRDERCQKA